MAARLRMACWVAAETVKESETKAEEGDVDASMAAAARAERLKEEHDQTLVTLTVRHAPFPFLPCLRRWAPFPRRGAVLKRFAPISRPASTMRPNAHEHAPESL